MADRVLPSREESAKRAGQLRAEGLSFTAEYLALDAIASGRLVDREAIDYEAAAVMLAELRRVKVIMVDANHSARRIVDAAFGLDVFVAAIGDTDE